MLEQFEKLKRDTFPIYFEGRYQHKNGSYRWLGWTAAPFVSEQLIYVFARDITARKSAEDQIKNLNHQLQLRINDLTEINKELEGFNYSISHDLRAPLRSIASLTQVVRSQYNESLPEEARDYLHRVENAANTWISCSWICWITAASAALKWN
jgi:signal transduction histidine kinase